jgi:hypothetical protein
VQNWIHTGASPDSVAVDSHHVYWTNGTTNRTIGWANIDGSNVSRFTLMRPMIAHATLTNKRFRVGTRPTAITAARTPVGTIIRFTLSAPANAQIAITTATNTAGHSKPVSLTFTIVR